VRVTIISLYDYAGSGKRIHESLLSINKDSYYITLMKAPLRLLGKYKKHIITDKDRERLLSSDIYIFKGDDTIQINERGLYVGKRYVGEIKKTAYRILLVSGSLFRGRAFSEKHIDKYKQRSDLMLAICPDLAFPHMGIKYLGFAIDTSKIKARGASPKKFTLSYYPAKSMAKDKKGVYNYLLPAIDKAGAGGIGKCIMGVSYNESLAIKRGSSVYFESISKYGSYGNSGMEAMAQGVPIIANIFDSVISQSNMDDYASPVIKVMADIDDLSLKIKGCMNGEYDLEEIGKKSAIYVEKYHSYNSIGRKLINYINNGILAK